MSYSANRKQLKKGLSPSFICEICGQEFADSRSLIFHKRKHNQQKVFACHLCPKKFSRSDHLKGHVLRHLHAGDHPCNQCDKIFKRADHLKYHQVNEHGSTISLKELRTYSRVIVSDCRKKIQCGQCNKTFHNEKNLKLHNRVHSSYSKYECRYCGKSFRQRSNLNVHIRKHTGAKPYKCESCDESFSTSCKLKTHARKHTGERPFVCDACGKCFGESHLLKMHMRIHDNSKAYVCSHCGQSFTHSSTLRSHIRTHTGAKPYTCDVCKESFAQISSLSYHKRTHTGEKPFVCDICGNKYTRKATLKSHQSRHTGDKVFSCSQCDFKCDITIQLRKHMLHSHVLKGGPVSAQSIKKVRQEPIDHMIQTQTAHNHYHKNICAEETLNSSLSSKVYHKTQHNRSEAIHGNLQDHVQQLVSLSPSANAAQEPMASEDVSGHSTSDVSVRVLPALCSSLVTQSSIFNSSFSYVIPSVEADHVPVRSEGTDPSSFYPTSVLPSDSPHVNCQASTSSIRESLGLSASHQSFSSYQNKIHDSSCIPLQQMVQLDLEPDLLLHDPSSPKDKILMNLFQMSQPVSENSSITPSQPLSSLNALVLNSLNSPTLPQTKLSSTERLDHHSCEKDGKESVPSTFPHQNYLNYVHNRQSDKQVVVTSTSRDDKHERDGTLADIRETSINESEIVTDLNPSSMKTVDNNTDTSATDLQVVIKNKNFKSTFDHFTNLSLEIGKTDLNLTENIKEDLKGFQKLESNIHMHSSISKLSISQSSNDNKEDNFQTSDPESLARQTNLDYGIKHIIPQPQSSCTKLPKLSSKGKETTKNKPGKQSKSSQKTRSNLPSKSINLDHIADPKSSERRTKKEKTQKHKSEDVSITVNHRIKYYSCQMCEQKFNHKCDLATHMCLHHGENPLKCSICCKEFSRSDHLNTHLLLHSKSKELRCYHCYNEFTDQKELDEHIRNVHNGLYPFKCNVCSFSCLDMMQLKGHVGDSHSDFKFSCQVCGLTGVTSKIFKEHMKAHPGESAFKCYLCDKSFSQISVWKLHTRRKHDKEKLFACGVCQRAFFIAADLQRHLRNHLGDRPFACKICKKTFADSKVLRLHCKTHVNEKPFQCSHCQRNFAHQSTLISHIRIHTGSKPFICDVCGDAFTQSSSLTHHQQIHNRQKMYTCHICGKSYTRMSTLNIHLLQHDGRSRFSCQHCAYQCNKTKALQRHMDKCQNIKAEQVNS